MLHYMGLGIPVASCVFPYIVHNGPSIKDATISEWQCPGSTTKRYMGAGGGTWGRGEVHGGGGRVLTIVKFRIKKFYLACTAVDIR